MSVTELATACMIMMKLGQVGPTTCHLLLRDYAFALVPLVIEGATA